MVLRSVVLAAMLVAIPIAASAVPKPSPVPSSGPMTPYVLVTSFNCMPHEATATPPASSTTALADGDDAMDRGQCARAVADFAAYIQEKPDDLKGYWRHGIALMALGIGEADASYFDKAGPDFDKAIAIAPKLPSLYELRGLCKLQALQYLARRRSPFTVGSFLKKTLGDVNDDLTQAITLDPNFGEAYGNRYLVDRERGDDAQAGYDERMAQRLDPAMLEIAMQRADLSQQRAAAVREQQHEATMMALEGAILATDIMAHNGRSLP